MREGKNREQQEGGTDRHMNCEPEPATKQKIHNPATFTIIRTQTKVFLTCYRFPMVFSSCLGFESFCPEYQLSAQTSAFHHVPSASNPASAGAILLGNPWVLANDSLLQLLL